MKSASAALETPNSAGSSCTSEGLSITDDGCAGFSSALDDDSNSTRSLSRSSEMFACPVFYCVVGLAIGDPPREFRIPYLLIQILFRLEDALVEYLLGRITGLLVILVMGGQVELELVLAILS
jgi:hypothetical protein